MTAPNWLRAEVNPRKLLDYLLSTTHPRGRSKAAFFRAIGFTTANHSELAEALRGHALNGYATVCETTRYGTLYQVDGEIISPSGKPAYLRSIWLVRPGGDTPQFITAYPLRTR